MNENTLKLLILYHKGAVDVKLYTKAEKREISRAVEGVLEKYYLYKFVNDFEDEEASITQSYEERFHGPTNTTSDQTGRVAARNVDARKYRDEFCQRVERIVSRLPDVEKDLITQRYLVRNAKYITDQQVYSFKLDPPVGATTYAKIRWSAFLTIAMAMRIVEPELEGSTC